MPIYDANDSLRDGAFVQHTTCTSVNCGMGPYGLKPVDQGKLLRDDFQDEI